MFEGIEAVIFDLDGTLVDSMWMWKEIDIEYLDGYGIELPPDLQSTIEGMSFSETAVYFQNRFGIRDDVDTIKNRWNEMARDLYANRVKPKPGVVDLLKKLKEKHIPTGIATSNSRELLDTVLKALDLEKYFDEIHVSCEVERGKPAPDIFLLVASCIGADPSKCLVFEDIIPGIEAARAAGMKVCAVYDDFSAHVDREKREMSDYYITDFLGLNP